MNTNAMPDLLRSPPPGTAPGAWRMGMVVLIGPFSDTAERVVMARTCSSPLESGRWFRPGSDSIVKDEGIPPSALEFLTRQSKG